MRFFLDGEDTSRIEPWRCNHLILPSRFKWKLIVILPSRAQSIHPSASRISREHATSIYLDDANLGRSIYGSSSKPALSLQRTIMRPPSPTYSESDIDIHLRAKAIMQQRIMIVKSIVWNTLFCGYRQFNTNNSRIGRNCSILWRLNSYEVLLRHNQSTRDANQQMNTHSSSYVGNLHKQAAFMNAPWQAFNCIYATLASSTRFFAGDSGYYRVPQSCASRLTLLWKPFEIYQGHRNCLCTWS